MYYELSSLFYEMSTSNHDLSESRRFFTDTIMI